MEAGREWYGKSCKEDKGMKSKKKGNGRTGEKKDTFLQPFLNLSGQGLECKIWMVDEKSEEMGWREE